ncbi:MAG: hypothetical protein GY716_10310 [bacterium]|nr:hypothetical protein [bacterium]
MPIKLSDMMPSNDQAWRGYPTDEKPDFEMLLSYTDASKMDDIRRRSRARNAIDAEDISIRKLNGILAEEVIQDWRGVEDDHGSAVSYSPKLCERLLAADLDVAKWATETASTVKEFLGEGRGVGDSA